MKLFPTSQPIDPIVYDRPVHACRMTRSEFFIHKGIRKASSAKPDERGYLVIFDYGTDDAKSIWCPFRSLDENQVTLISRPKYSE